MTQDLFKDWSYKCFITAMNLYDRKIICTSKFFFVTTQNLMRGLRNCLANYRGFNGARKKATIENQCSDKPSEVDILSIKRSWVRRLISDSKNECWKIS